MVNCKICFKMCFPLLEKFAKMKTLATQTEGDRERGEGEDERGILSFNKSRILLFLSVCSSLSLSLSLYPCSSQCVYKSLLVPVLTLHEHTLFSPSSTLRI